MRGNTASARLMKWPSVAGERVSTDGTAPYTITHGALRECVDALRRKPQSTYHLYEVRLEDGSAFSAAEALALIPRNDGHPPADYGGGDLTSLQRDQPTDDERLK